MTTSSRTLGNSTLQVLATVAAGTRYGFDIMDATGLQSGTVYRALGRLEELGMVASEWAAAELALEATRPRRRYYRVTAAGERELENARRRFAAFARQTADALSRS